ncbi:MAG: translation initiation factor IF-3 [Patescibacteria group bacterium]|nr:translation initiation factor IF-3 [Patescibacteria group bacterium]
MDENGVQLGIMSINEALKIAGDKNLDLIEVSSNVNPPIVKINDWGKYNYQRIKQLKKNRKNSKDTELKQMRLGLKIGDHDLQIKLNKVLKFIENNHKVKFIIIYKGREQAHKEIGFKLAEKIIEMLGEKIIVDQKPTLAGRQLSFAIRKGN